MVASSNTRPCASSCAPAARTAAASATQTVTATLAPHLAPLTPVIYVVRVLHAAVGVYYAVATLSTTGLGTVFSGQNPLTAVANVVSSVQGLANVLTHAPRPTAASNRASPGPRTSGPDPRLQSRSVATSRNPLTRFLPPVNRFAPR